MRTTDEYLELITSEHRDQPQFMESVQVSIEPFVDIQAVLLQLIQDFDLDQAVGVQLDAVGLWIGVSRRVAVPLAGYYFTWDDTPATGWDAGVWKGVGDPDSGLIDLPDDIYRSVLRAKIRANHWTGDIPGAYEIAILAFPALEGGNILIMDNQDMTQTITINGAVIAPVELAIITQGYLPLKPAGIETIYVVV